MNQQVCDMRQRLDFIERTITHAARACDADRRTPAELKHFITQLEWHSHKTRRALEAHDRSAIRAHLEDLAQASERAQSAIAPKHDFALKSAVILAHIEVSALKLQAA